MDLNPWKIAPRDFSLSEAGLPLMPNGENQRDIFARLVTVERDIAALAVGDDELPQARLAGATHERMAFENLDTIDNDVDGRDRRVGGLAAEEIGQALEIGERAP
jgi:hypothetical protein